MKPKYSIAKFDGREIDVSALWLQLKPMDEPNPFYDALVQEVINDACVEAGISPEQSEIEDEIDRYRAERDLLTEASTIEWLQEHHMTDDEFEELIKQKLKRKKLQEQVTANKIEQRFVFRKTFLEAAELYSIQVSDEELARELTAQIAEGADFQALARQFSEDKNTRKQGGYLGIVKRSDMRPEVESLVFCAQENQLAGMVKSLGSYQILYVEKLCHAVLNERTRVLLSDEIFEEWIDKRMHDGNLEILI